MYIRKKKINFTKNTRNLIPLFLEKIAQNYNYVVSVIPSVRC